MVITRAQPYQIGWNLEQNYQHDETQVPRGGSGLLLNTHNNKFVPRCAFSGGPREQNEGAAFFWGSAFIIILEYYNIMILKYYNIKVL